MIDPAAEIVHYGGASEPVRSAKMVRLFVAKAQLFRKFMPPLSAWFALRTLDLWAVHRMSCFFLLRLVSSRYADKLLAWREIWRERGQWRSAWAATEPYGAAPARVASSTRA